MSRQVSNSDMHEFACTVWKLAGFESVESQTAMACLVLNRLESAARCESRYGAGTLAAACSSVLVDHTIAGDTPKTCDAGFADIGFCRVFSIVCGVWSGDLVDPTNGAVDFHDHTQNPVWSRDRTPNALIGRHFYYP